MQNSHLVTDDVLDRGNGNDPAVTDYIFLDAISENCRNRVEAQEITISSQHVMQFRWLLSINAALFTNPPVGACR